MKKVIVTAGCNGLGLEFTKTLLNQGYFVIPTSREEVSFIRLYKEIEEVHHERISPMVLSFEGEEDIDNFIDKIIEKHGQVYGLVNNAVARYKQQDLKDLTIDDYRAEFDVNVFATMYLSTQIGIKAMEDNGSIVMISSVYSSVVPDYRVYSNDMVPTGPGYSGSKATMNYYTKYLAVYFAQKPIRVNCIIAGGVRDELRQNDYFHDAYKYRTPMNRMAKPNEFNSSLEYLLNENNSYCTGQLLHIDGGWTLF